MKSFLLLAIFAMTFCVSLYATTTGQAPAAEWPIPAGLGAIGAAVVWGARMLSQQIERSSKRSDDQITRLCEVAHRAIDETRESKNAFEAGRRTFISAANFPSDTSLRPRPKGDSPIREDTGL